MHELSVAMSIVEMAEEEARRRGLRINAIHLQLGPLAGVVEDALRSAYELACENTELYGSSLVIEKVPIVVFCAQCQERRQLASAQDFSCPVCHSPTPEVLAGRELIVRALEVKA